MKGGLVTRDAKTTEQEPLQRRVTKMRETCSTLRTFWCSIFWTGVLIIIIVDVKFDLE